MKKGAQHETPSRKDALSDDLFWHRVAGDLEHGPGEEVLRQDEEESETPAKARVPRRVGPWVKTTIGLIAASSVLAAATFGLRSALVRAARDLPSFLGAKPLKFYVALAHILVLGMILTLLSSSVRSRSPESPVAQRAFRQFERGWALLWASWLGLYVWLALAWGEVFGATAQGVAPWVFAIADLFNISSSAIFLYLFLVLDRPSVKATGEPARDRAFRRGLFGVLAVCGATAISSVLGRFDLFQLQEFGPMLGSILAAISMAYFFGRLSDSHMKIRRALLAPLYLYVAIQMLWHLFQSETGGPEVAHSLVFCGALLLKIYLFAVVTRWIATGTLQTYFDEVAFPRSAADLEEL